MILLSKQCGHKASSNPDWFAWESLQLNIDKCSYFLNSSVFCQEAKTQVTFLSNYRAKFDDALIICKAHGGHVYLPQSKQDMDETTESFPGSASFYVGALKNHLYGVEDLNKNAVTYLPWSPSQPNGKSFQECIIAEKCHEGSSYLYNDISCLEEMPFVCQVPAWQSFKLRGELDETNIDRKYVQVIENNQITYKGNVKSKITHEKNGQGWGIWSNNGTYLSISKTSMSPFGTKSWSQDRELLLTQCGDDSFTCSNHGNCIHISKRCNGEVDCPDRSDELNCNIIKIPNNYRAKYHPEICYGHLTHVNVTLFIKNVFGINEKNMEFKVRVKITMEWYDHRLTYENLKDHKDMNIVSNDQMQKLWMPCLIYYNSNDGDRTIVDESASLLVRKIANASTNDLAEIQENLLYKGDINALELSRYELQ